MVDHINENDLEIAAGCSELSFHCWRKMHVLQGHDYLKSTEKSQVVECETLRMRASPAI